MDSHVDLRRSDGYEEGAEAVQAEGGPHAGAEAELAARLRMAVTRISRRLRQQAETGATPSQLSALSSVERLGPLTLGDLALQERVQPPSMTRVVANLEDSGLVVRQVDDKDRRVVRVQLTAEGRKVLQRSRTRKNAYLARRMRAIGGEDRAVLAEAVAVLERLIEDRG